MNKHKRWMVQEVIDTIDNWVGKKNDTALFITKDGAGLWWAEIKGAKISKINHENK